MEVPGGEIRWDSRDRESRFCLFGEQVSGVRIDTRHRPSERDRLLLVSEQEQIKLLPIVIKFHLFYGPRPFRNQRYGVAHVVEMVPIGNFPNQGKALNSEQ